MTRPLKDSNSTNVRVTFQRRVRNTQGQVKRIETLKYVTLYEQFFKNLSEAVFLHAHEI